MTPEEFRAAGHALIDWIADERGRVAQRPVMPAVGPGDVKRAMPTEVPEGGDAIEAFLADLDRIVVPGLLQVQHPNHFGWFPSNASLSSVLGDIASSGIGALGITWQSAPALTEVEEVCCDWMRRLCGLSDAWRGTIHDTASTATLVAMLAARERASGYVQYRGGLQSLDAPLVVYTTPHAHTAVLKGALLAGFGADHVRQIATQAVTHAMDPGALAHAMSADAAAGLTPAIVVASVGSTGVTAVDPVPQIVEAAARHCAWVHVDAAMAGSAMLLPEMRHLFTGIEGVDSLAWNPHKWMGTILDCSLFFVREPEQLIRVMSTNASYLHSAADGQVVQYRDWGIPLGRRFRSLKLWAQLRFDGPDAIRARLRRDLANARWLAGEVAAAPGWRVVAPVPLQTVCVRHEPDGVTGDALDAHTLRWVEAINHSGRAFLTPATLDGRWMVRVSIGVESTEREHVEALWALMREEAERSAATR